MFCCPTCKVTKHWDVPWFAQLECCESLVRMQLECLTVSPFQNEFPRCRSFPFYAKLPKTGKASKLQKWPVGNFRNINATSLVFFWRRICECTKHYWPNGLIWNLLQPKIGHDINDIIKFSPEKHQLKHHKLLPFNHQKSPLFMVQFPFVTVCVG